MIHYGRSLTLPFYEIITMYTSTQRSGIIQFERVFLKMPDKIYSLIALTKISYINLYLDERFQKKRVSIMPVRRRLTLMNTTM